MGETSPIRPQIFDTDDDDELYLSVGSSSWPGKAYQIIEDTNDTDDADLSGICQRGLIGRRCNSNFILLAVVYEWQIKDKRSQISKVKVNNQLKHSLSHETPQAARTAEGRLSSQAT